MLYEFMSKLDAWIWGWPFLLTLVFGGILFIVLGKGFTIVHFGHILKHTLGSLTKKEARDGGKTGVSPFGAVCVAIGGCVGTANISGVAAAIAVGGPGAVFWMWVWAFFAMALKMGEVTLGSYYRKKTPEGNFVGGSYYYLSEGIGKRKNWKIGFGLAWMFSLCFFCMFLSGAQAPAIAESLHASFNIPMIPFTLAFTAFLIYVTWKGVPRIVKFASKVVPWMCVAYIVGALAVIVLNWRNVPSAISSIFVGAFTGRAAVGGFLGSSVALAIRQGVARAVNSNEAGMGTSPMIHARANTIHPVRQGLWGSFEVFVDTIVVCSCTALAVVCSGLWTSGDTAMTLAVSVFRDSFGVVGIVFISAMMLLFGLTTASGAFAYYAAALDYMLRNHPGAAKVARSIFRIAFFLPNLMIVGTMVWSGADFNLYWAFVDVIIALPVFFNVIGLIILSPQFMALLKDYKARYMGIGKVDTNFKIFYETDANEEAAALNQQFVEEQA